MNHSLIIKPEVERDLRDAMEWYNEQRAGLGDEFLAEVERAFDRICENPGLHSCVHRDIRRALTKRFPYGVFFIVEGDCVAVLAVMHVSRHPGRWRQRR